MKTLTPAQQQALWHLLASLLIGALIAGLSAVMPYVMRNTPIDWHIVGAIFSVAFLGSLGHSVAANLKKPPTPNDPTQSDPTQNTLPIPTAALGDVLDAFISALEKRYATSPLLNATVPAGMPITSIYPVDQPSMPQHLASLSDIPLQDIGNLATAKRPAV